MFTGFENHEVEELERILAPRLYRGSPPDIPQDPEACFLPLQGWELAVVIRKALDILRQFPAPDREMPALQLRPHLRGLLCLQVHQALRGHAIAWCVGPETACGAPSIQLDHIFLRHRRVHASIQWRFIEIRIHSKPGGHRCATPTH